MVKVPPLHVSLQVFVSSKHRRTRMYKTISCGQSDGVITHMILTHGQLLLAMRFMAYCVWLILFIKELFLFICFFI